MNSNPLPLSLPYTMEDLVCRFCGTCHVRSVDVDDEEQVSRYEPCLPAIDPRTRTEIPARKQATTPA